MTWTYTVLARANEDLRACLERAVVGVIATAHPFGAVVRVEITTEARGEDAFVFAEPVRNLQSIHEALLSEPSRRVLSYLDLTVDYPDGRHELLAGAARVYVDVDDQSRQDNSVQLWLVLDVDIYAPVSWGDERDNAELARINGPRLTGFLERLQNELGAQLEDIDVGDYAGKVDATGFHP